MPALSKVQFRRGTAAAWASANPVLASGEPGYETDTGKEKRGDGTTAWNALAYFTSAPALTWVATKAAAYAAVAGEAVPADTTLGSFAVTLPTGSAVGSTIRVKWKTGVLPPTVIAAGGRALDASWPGFVAAGDSVTFVDDGTTWNVV